MRHELIRVAPVLHLTRVTTAFAAVANVWFVVLWSRAANEAGGFEEASGIVGNGPLWAVLGVSAVNALGLFAFAAVLNDVLDIRRDRTLHPERPLPSGRVSLEGALVLAVGTLIVAVLGAAAMGMWAVMLTCAIAGAVLFFHAAGKYIPALSFVVLGIIYAGQMLVPNVGLRFIWPVWLVMTHSLVVGAVSHFLGKKVPMITRRAMGFAVIGWAFWSFLMLWVAWKHNAGNIWPSWVGVHVAIWPAALAVLFAVLAMRRIRSLGRSARAAEKVTRYGALWLALYGCAWLLGQGYTTEGLWLVGLTAAGFFGMTVLREVYAMIEHPITYRR